MTKKRLWLRREIEVIEPEYHDHSLFRAVRNGCHEWAAHNQGMALSQIELFYHVVRSLDDLRGMHDHDERTIYCSSLKAEMMDYISTHGEYEDHDLHEAAKLVTHIVGQCLLAYSRLSFFNEIIKLFGATKDIDPKLLGSLSNIGRDQNLKLWLGDYMTGSTFISDEIEDRLKEMREIAEREKRELEILKSANIEQYFGPGSINNDNRNIVTINVQDTSNSQLKALINEQQLLCQRSDS